MSRESEIKKYKTYAISKNYNDETFDRIYEIFCTYRNRGGILNFSEFAGIPIKKNTGKDLDQESGFWTKFIRERLAEKGI